MDSAPEIEVDWGPEGREETEAICPNCGGNGWTRERISYPAGREEIAINMRIYVVMEMCGCALCQRPEDVGHADRRGTGRVTATVIKMWRSGVLGRDFLPS